MLRCAVTFLVTVLVLNIIFVTGAVNKGNGLLMKSNQGKGAGNGKNGPVAADAKGVQVVGSPVTSGDKLLKCAVCHGKSWEECDKAETTKPCPPGSKDRACTVIIKYQQNKVQIQKKCTRKKTCDIKALKSPADCLQGNFGKGKKQCDFCCETDDCNKGFPLPQFKEVCSGWSDWSNCSTQCGKGNQTRSQTCHKEVVSYNLWGKTANINGHNPKAGSEESFFPKLPDDETKNNTKVEHKTCEIKPCKEGERPPQTGAQTSGSDGVSSSSSLFFAATWFLFAWLL